MAIDRNDTTLISHWSRNGEVQTKLYLPAKNEAEKPGLLVFGRVDGSGVLQAPYCMWIDSSGNPRISADYPTDENVSGSTFGGSTTFIGLTDTPANFTGAANKFVRVNAAGNALEFDTVTGDVTVAADGTTAIASGVVINDDINSSAAIAFTKLATLTRGSVLIGNSSNQVAAVDAKTDGYILIGDDTDLNSVAVSGDIAITNTGVTSISTGVIVNNDVNASAAIVESKIAFNTSTGHNHDGITSKLVSVGTANNLAQTGSLEAGGSDLAWSWTTQTSAGTVGIRDLNLATGTDYFVFEAATQTFTNKTLTSPVLTTPQINDTSANHQYIFAVSELAADRTVTLPLLAGNDTFVFADFIQTLTNKTLTSPVLTTPQINDTSADHQYIFAVNELAADRTVTLPLLAGNDTFVFNDFAATLTNKTLTSPVLTTPQINDTSADHQYVFAVSELAADRNVTLPLLAGDDTFVFNDFAATLTNKTIDVDANTVSNVNATELDPVTIAGATIFAMPYCLFVINGGASTVNITLPYKSRIIYAHAVATKGCSGNWKLNDAAAGGGNDITTTVSYSVDQTVSVVAKIDDLRHEIAAGTISLVNSDNTDTAIVTIWCVRVN